MKEYSTYSRDGIIYKLLSGDYLNEAVDCLTDEFTLHEPIVKSLGITSEMFKPYVWEVCIKAIREKLSFVAIDEDTDELLGCAIVEDFGLHSEAKELMLSRCPEIEPRVLLVETLASKFREKNRVKEGKYIRLFMIAVISKTKGIGIATILNELIFRHSKYLGYEKVIAEPTGKISQNILLNKYHFEKIDSIKYKDFIYNGKKPLEKIKIPESCVIAIKNL